MRAAGLELLELSKHYGGRAVVERLSLSVPEGELLVLVGPSGSGKSTLLRMIAGLTPHDAGEVRVCGRNVGALPPAERDMAMVFQSYALFPHMTIAENLGFGMQARKVPAQQRAERIETVAAGLGLAPMLARYPRQLSGGERQRVALGRAMLREPKLFLLDEPLSNLDAQLRVQTRAEILRLHERLATTMVYVTHDQIEALSMGDRVGVLRGGVLEDIGTPSDIYRRPRTLFTATFIGSPPMNTLQAEVAARGQLRWQDHRVDIGVALADALGAAGRRVVLGVRPEHVAVVGSRWAQAAGKGMLIDAQVQLLEFAGDQVFATLGVGSENLIARVEPELGLQRGQTVQFSLQPEALHVFDPASGLSLLQR